MRTARSAVATTVRAFALAVVVLSGVTMLPGCVTTVRPAPPAPVPAPVPPPKGSERVSEGAVATQTGPTTTGSALSLDLRALGTVPCDGYTLPLLSPDGRFLAVQTGTAPDRATMLARDGQRPPIASRIALYRLSSRGIERLGETEAGIVLGRSADARGFLIESPRPDGARWIGRIAWGTAASTRSYEPEWLVQDGRVNAFAALGASGELAYCARDVGARAFDLVVRRDGRPMTLGGNGVRSYMLPVLSPDGAKVMAIALRDGIVELASAETASEAAMSQSLVKSFVTDRGNDETAMQMSVPQGARDGIDGADMLVYHPVLRTVARWNDRDGMRPVAEDALAACRLDARRTVYLSGSAVRVGDGAASPQPGTLVLDRTAVPRALGVIDGAPAVLLLAPEGGSVRLFLARFPATRASEPLPRA